MQRWLRALVQSCSFASFFAARIRAKFSKGERAAAHCAKRLMRPLMLLTLAKANPRPSVLNSAACARERAPKTHVPPCWSGSFRKWRQDKSSLPGIGGPHHCERCSCGRARVEIMGEPNSPQITARRSRKAATAARRRRWSLCGAECVLSASLHVGEAPAQSTIPPLSSVFNNNSKADCPSLAVSVSTSIWPKHCFLFKYQFISLWQLNKENNPTYVFF